MPKRASESKELSDLLNDFPAIPPPGDEGHAAEAAPSAAAATPAPTASEEAGNLAGLIAPQPTGEAPAGGLTPSVTGQSGVSGDRPSEAAGPSAGSSPATPTPAPDASTQAQLADARHRLEMQERELAFLRQRSTAPAPAPPSAPNVPTIENTVISAENILPFRVTAADMEVLTDDPERGAAVLNDAFTRFGLHVANLVLNRMVAIYDLVKAHERQQQEKQDTEQAQARFLATNADLVPYAAFLQGFVQQVWSEGTRAPENLLAEAARRLRLHFRLPMPAAAGYVPAGGAPTVYPGVGATPGVAPYPSVAAPPLRPATADMPANSGGYNGATQIPQTEREILDLARH